MLEKKAITDEELAAIDTSRMVILASGGPLMRVEAVYCRDDKHLVEVTWASQNRLGFPVLHRSTFDSRQLRDPNHPIDLRKFLQ